MFFSFFFCLFVLILKHEKSKEWSRIVLFFFTNQNTTLNSGYLGSRNDEERSEMRYVMRIAEFSESSNL